MELLFGYSVVVATDCALLIARDSNMMNKSWAVTRESKIVGLEEVEVPKGTHVSIIRLPEDGTGFWLASSESSLNEASRKEFF